MEFIINKFFEFNDEAIRQLKETLKTLILDLQKLSQLDLSLLESIIVPDDFDQELILFQREHKLLEGFTHNEHAKAYGKVLDYKNEVRYSWTSILLQLYIVKKLSNSLLIRFTMNYAMFMTISIK